MWRNGVGGVGQSGVEYDNFAVPACLDCPERVRRDPFFHISFDLFRPSSSSSFRPRNAVEPTA